jgi:PBP1b-binding outer membrane lipoprotein LpoB
MKNRFSFIVEMLTFGLFITGCVTTTSGYRPDPSIPVENLATLTIANQSVRVTAIDGIETPVNYPKAIKIQPGKHTITCYHQKSKEIMTEMSRNFGGNASLFNYFTEIEFEFLSGGSYELYDSSETKTIGTLQSTEYSIAIREAAR